MGYWQTSVIIDGALDQEDDQTDHQLRQTRDEMATWATAHPDKTVEVYAIWHDHARNVDCECIQFVTDHHPLDRYGP